MRSINRSVRGTWVFVAALFLVIARGGPALAQFSDCRDTLALVSPSSLDISFVESPVRGNQLWWPALDPADAACVRAEVSASLAASVAPEILGDWADLDDRELEFLATTSGDVGSKSDPQLRLSLSSSPPNPTVPNLGAVLNLSGAGGAFRLDLGANSATQINDGLPEHLTSTDITALAAAPVVGGGTRVYAAITGIPVVRSDDGGDSWFEPLIGTQNPVAAEALNLAVAPTNPDLLFLGTARDGILRSDDGGQTWVQADNDIRAPGQAIRVLLLEYLRVDVGGQMIDRLYTSLRGVGFFFSDDGGSTWQQISNLQVPIVKGGTVTCPDDTLVVAMKNVDVESITVSPSDSRTLYVGVRQWGVYRGSVDHAAWTPAYDGLVICADVNGSGSTASVTDVVVHPQQVAGQDVLFASTEFRGVFFSSNGGSLWSDISQTAAFPTDADSVLEEVSAILPDPTGGQAVVAAFANAGLRRWSQSLGDWVEFDGGGGLYSKKIGAMSQLPGSQQLIVGTTGNGVYEVGDEIELSRAVASAGVDLGVRLRFNMGGALVEGESFDVFGQAFQAYAVWRALSTDLVTGEPQWQMIGLFDLTNPESCSLDPCDSPSQTLLPDCFADKRANCFDTRQNGGRLEWGFFDSDVFNGFTYHYAISALDYGFTGDISPQVFDGDFLFSPRHPAESNHQAAIFLGVRPENWAYRVFQANVDPRTGLDEVFAVPNPLQRQGSWDIATDEATIRFRNVSDSAKVQVFTLAGDLVRVLDNVITEGAERGNIQWDTRNAEGNRVASGVYIYRVTDATGAEFVSKVTIIR
jgi:hypothetical protein